MVLRHYQDDCASLNMSVAQQVEGMEANSITGYYTDLRSPSRAHHQHLRKHRAPTPRWKRCHRDCPTYSRCHMSSPRRRTRQLQAECNDEAYWDKRVVKLDYCERLEFMDPVQAYYEYGHNAQAMESLRPTNNAEEEEKKVDGHDWIDVSSDTDLDSEVEVITTPSWTLYLYDPTNSNSHSLIAGDGFVEFEACTFTWHRNASGCWELGYANQYMVDEDVDPYGCKQAPIPLSCHCCSYNFGVYACSCKFFPSSWPSPEDQQRCHLLDWMDHGAWDAMDRADAVFAATREVEREWSSASHQPQKKLMGKAECGGEWTFVRSAQASRSRAEEGEWDLVSSLSSTGSWRVVDVT